MQFTLYGVTARRFPLELMDSDQDFNHYLCKVYGNQMDAARAARQLCKFEEVGTVRIQILRARHKPTTIEVPIVETGTKELPRLNRLIEEIRDARRKMDNATHKVE